MSTLPKKLLKSCNKKNDKPSNKLGKKLLSHEVSISEILPLILELADSEEKKQYASDRMIELLAPKASPKRKAALAFHLQSLGLGQADQEDTQSPPEPSLKQPLKLVDQDSFATKPFKSKPCSSCPALKNGLCKCALKRAEKVQQEQGTMIAVAG